MVEALGLPPPRTTLTRTRMRTRTLRRPAQDRGSFHMLKTRPEDDSVNRTRKLEIDPDTLPPEAAPKPPGEAFREVLGRLTGRAKPPTE